MPRRAEWQINNRLFPIDFQNHFLEGRASRLDNVQQCGYCVGPHLSESHKRSVVRVSAPTFHISQPNPKTLALIKRLSFTRAQRHPGEPTQNGEEQKGETDAEPFPHDGIITGMAAENENFPEMR
jgi:hypothetical protein